MFRVIGGVVVYSFAVYGVIKWFNRPLVRIHAEGTRTTTS